MEQRKIENRKKVENFKESVGIPTEFYWENKQYKWTD